MSKSIFFLLLIIAAFAVVEINGSPDSNGRDVHIKIKDAQESSSPAPFTVSFINVIMTFIFARIMV